LPHLGRLCFYVIFGHPLFFRQIQKFGSFCTKGQGQTRFFSSVWFFLRQGFFGDFPLLLNPPTDGKGNDT
jgi:hypothetical protein